MAQSTTLEKKVTEFAIAPGPRYREQGKKSGEEFYAECLKPWFMEAQQNDATLTIILDGTEGYLTSFIDEAFGRLVYDFGLEQVKKSLYIISRFEPEWLNRLEKRTYPNWESRRLKGEAPRNTEPIG